MAILPVLGHYHQCHHSSHRVLVKQIRLRWAHVQWCSWNNHCIRRSSKRGQSDSDPMAFESMHTSQSRLHIPLHELAIVLITNVRFIKSKYPTSCGARHNKPRPLLPPSERHWLVNASPLSYGAATKRVQTRCPIPLAVILITNKLTFDPPTRLPELTKI